MNWRGSGGGGGGGGGWKKIVGGRRGSSGDFEINYNLQRSLQICFLSQFEFSSQRQSYKHPRRRTHALNMPSRTQNLISLLKVQQGIKNSQGSNY